MPDFIKTITRRNGRFHWNISSKNPMYPPNSFGSEASWEMAARRADECIRTSIGSVASQIQMAA